MVSRQPADKKFLDLQKAESGNMLIMSFVAKCCVEKKKDKINTNGIQTASREKISRSTKCRISYSVDYVFCGYVLLREEKGQERSTPMVSRQPADRKILDLQKAESATAWIISSVANVAYIRRRTRSAPMVSRQPADR